jgi:hypothetical protein
MDELACRDGRCQPTIFRTRKSAMASGS